LFFADGGLLALGCNVVNLGFFPCFIAYPLLFRPIMGSSPTRARLTAASVVAAIVGLQLGAFGVVLETRLSGLSALPMDAFLLVMQPIHLAIGAVEGLATAAVLLFLCRARPDALYAARRRAVVSKKLVAGLLVAALAVGGMLSWFASTKPDGLEWSISEASGIAETAASVAAATPWPAVDAGTSLSGVIGAALTLLLAGLIGIGVRRRYAAKG
jgi:cobalt/nickel transport system permease protein